MEENKKPMDAWKAFTGLFHFIKPYGNWFVVCILATLTGAFCEIFGVYLIRSMIDNALTGQHLILIRILILGIIMTLAGIAARYWQADAAGRFGNGAIRDMRKKTVVHIGTLPVSEVEKNHSADLVSRLNNDVSAVEGFIINEFANFIHIPLIIAASFTYLVTINWKLLLASFLVTPLALVAVHYMSKPINRYSAKYYENLGEVNGIVQDTIGGITILKAFNLEKPLYSKCKAALDKALNQSYKIVRQDALRLPVIIVMYELPYVLCTVFGGYMALKGQIEPGALVAFIQLLRIIIHPTTRLPQMLTNLQSTAGAASRIFEVLERTPERVEGRALVTDQREPVLEMKEIVFGYNSENTVLRSFSLTLQEGQTVALVGPSGCGKSTVINLICEFYPLQDGELYLYGRNYTEWKLSALREKMSLVSQDAYLFPGTIRENIRYGRQDAAQEEIIVAAKSANAHDFIMEMPDGYDTMVGERGAKLSGGQKQRLSIARAILKNASLLLMDEPTSALDTHSESLVQEAIDKVMKQRTVLVVAHRLSTIKNADRILVMDEGSVVQSGSHEQLMEQEGLYRQLYLKQFAGNRKEESWEEGACAC
jgi:ABC-type multidrug transport system fused ATPase/permease subunit